MAPSLKTGTAASLFFWKKTGIGIAANPLFYIPYARPGTGKSLFKTCICFYSYMRTSIAATLSVALLITHISHSQTWKLAVPILAECSLEWHLRLPSRLTFLPLLPLPSHPWLKEHNNIKHHGQTHNIAWANSLLLDYIPYQYVRGHGNLNFQQYLALQKVACNALNLHFL